MTERMDAQGTIVLTVPGRAQHSSLLRLLVASVAAEQGCSVDEIDDIRLAVSEIFNSFLSANATRISLEMTADAGVLGVLIHAEGTPPSPLDELANTIVRSVVDSYRLDDTTVVFTKRVTELSR